MPGAASSNGYCLITGLRAPHEWPEQISRASSANFKLDQSDYSAPGAQSAKQPQGAVRRGKPPGALCMLPAAVIVGPGIYHIGNVLRYSRVLPFQPRYIFNVSFVERAHAHNLLACRYH